MKLIVLADGSVGYSIVSFLSKNYPEQLDCVVTTGENEIYHLARENGVSKVVVFESEKNLLESIDSRFEIGILAWWPNIISEKLMNWTTRGFLNTHPSLIPWGRGKNYNFWAIVEQSPFGVSIHEVSREIDAGDVVAQKNIQFDYSMNAEDLYNMAQSEMISLFEEFWPNFLSGRVKPRQVNTQEGSFHFGKEMEAKSEISLNESYKARELINLLRARTFTGRPACWFAAEDGEVYEIRVKINKVQQIT